MTGVGKVELKSFWQGSLTYWRLLWHFGIRCVLGIARLDVLEFVRLFTSFAGCSGGAESQDEERDVKLWKVFFKPSTSRHHGQSLRGSCVFPLLNQLHIDNLTSKFHIYCWLLNRPNSKLAIISRRSRQNIHIPFLFWFPFWQFIPTLSIRDVQ